MLLSRQRANEKSPGGSEGDFELDLYVLECEEVASDFRITISAGMCAGGGNQAAGVCVCGVRRTSFVGEKERQRRVSRFGGGTGRVAHRKHTSLPGVHTVQGQAEVQAHTLNNPWTSLFFRILWCALHALRALSASVSLGSLEIVAALLFFDPNG